MKRILLTTTSLVLAAGVAQAEVTFSGKAEAGVSRTSKVDAVAAVAGVKAVVGNATADTVGFAEAASGLIVRSAATTASVAATNTEKLSATASLNTAKNAALVTEEAIREAVTESDIDTTTSAHAAALYTLAVAQANYNAVHGTAAVAAVKEGDMVAYSGYDMEVAVSSTLDNGMVVSAGFDMGAGSIADRDDDRVLDAQAAAVALSAVTIKNGGVTYVIGNDEIDDLYDDTQNGDVSVSGSMGGISYTLVADLDKDTAAVAAVQKYTAAATTRTAASTGIYNANGSQDTSTTVAAGDSDYVAATWVDTAAVAAVHESTSLKLSGAAAGVDWSFTTTNKDDFGDAASLITLGYAAGDALSFTLKHDTDGAAEAINTLSATYTMDAISLTVSASDDKDHARNTNTGGKASQNMTIAYANGPLTASFNNDESSAWWATTSYDLGNGADIFATVDHTEFAVVGLTFAF
ncbi:hypothetical protein N9I81_00585 [Planktomarina temperata]|nr:hypothetical protein [Planktomarina temperata]